MPPILVPQALPGGPAGATAAPCLGQALDLGQQQLVSLLGLLQLPSLR